MRTIVSLVSALLLLIGMTAAKADDSAICSKGSGDQMIAACTRVISSSRLKGHKLAFIFNSRGNAYHRRGDYDRAIADYTEAIRLDPKYAIVYGNRGNSYRLKGDYDRAIADLTEAIRLDPKYAIAYNNRGNATG